MRAKRWEILVRLSLLATVLWHLACTSAMAAPEADIAAFAKSIEVPLVKARYMEGECALVAVPRWEGLPTQQCRYSVRDKKTGERKQGVVVLFNPSAQKLAEWILNACEQVAPKQTRTACTSRVFGRVLDQSGGQFPVAGVVYEDLIPKDGVNEAYAFRDGVTVLQDGVDHRGTGALSEGELTAALTGMVRKTASGNGPARVVG